MQGALPLGRMLVASGLVTQDTLDDVVASQKSDGRRLAELLFEKGLLHPQQLAQLLAHQLACPWISLERIEVSHEALDLLPRDVAMKHRVAPIHLRTARGKPVLYVAIEDPTDDGALAAASAAATMPVRPMIALGAEIKAFLDRIYDGNSGIGQNDTTPTLPPAVPKVSKPPPPKPGAQAPLPPVIKMPGEGSAPKMPVAVAVLEEADVIEVNPTTERPELEPAKPELTKSEPAQSGTYAKGTIVDGRYELLRDLGGRVAGSRWEVRHLKTARRAVLRIGLRVSKDESLADAIRREERVLTRLQHGGAIDLRDAGTTAHGDPFIVLEPLEGRTLESLVAARGALAPLEACALMRQIADVLAAAHGAGVLHHEVRPENVFVVRDPWGIERVKLAHWEAATMTEGAPEPAVDLAGLGACAFLALAGRSRGDGEDVTQADLAPDVAAVIAGAIGGATASRFQSAKAFIDALEAAAPRSRDSMLLLQSSPEMRASVKPQAPIVEMRRFPRAAYRTPVRIQTADLGAIDGRIEEVSARGVFVLTRRALVKPLPDGTAVTVRFALPLDGQVVIEPGVVRWSRGSRSKKPTEPHAIGIELTSPKEESTRQITTYVASSAPPSGRPKF